MKTLAHKTIKNFKNEHHENEQRRAKEVEKKFVNIFSISFSHNSKNEEIIIQLYPLRSNKQQ